MSSALRKLRAELVRFQGVELCAESRGDTSGVWWLAPEVCPFSAAPFAGAVAGGAAALGGTAAPVAVDGVSGFAAG
jgi:hypothetical protein